MCFRIELIDVDGAIDETARLAEGETTLAEMRLRAVDTLRFTPPGVIAVRIIGPDGAMLFRCYKAEIDACDEAHAIAAE
ncbi:MAG: hypothetical protein AB7J28_14175 [Hyphomonadaceae bacterium]